MDISAKKQFWLQEPMFDIYCDWRIDETDEAQDGRKDVNESSGDPKHSVAIWSE